MKRQAPNAMIEPFDTNPMTKLCYLIGNNAFLIQILLSEYLKFVEIAIVLVLDLKMMNKLFHDFDIHEKQITQLIGAALGNYWLHLCTRVLYS
jgi:hypothetical protein